MTDIIRVRARRLSVVEADGRLAYVEPGDYAVWRDESGRLMFSRENGQCFRLSRREQDAANAVKAFETADGEIRIGRDLKRDMRFEAAE